MAEEKKPEAPKKEEASKRTLLDISVESYLGAKKDPVKSLGSVPFLDELRKNTYLMTIERAHKEIDPEDEYAQLSQTFGQIKQDMGYFTGEERYGPQFKGLGIEEQISMYITLGTKLINDTIHPEGAGGQKRRRR